MPKILSIETATTVCSVAVTYGQEVLAQEKLYSERSHANELTLLIEKNLKKIGLGLDEIDALALSEGPGSYTGLRIGTSTAKGICYALGIPLIAVSTLQAMVLEMAKDQNIEKGVLCPMIDARRMEVYTATFEPDMTELTEPTPMILDETSFKETLSKHSVFFGGNGCAKFKELINEPNAQFYPDLSPSAWAVGLLAEKKYLDQEFENLAYFEPKYLKAFQATKPKKLL